jgi:hypothetical protein
MIANALSRDVLRTPAQALEAALAAAHRRFAIGGRVVHMDGRQRGTLRDIVVEDGVVRLVIVTDENQIVRAMPGYWSRSSL